MAAGATAAPLNPAYRQSGFDFHLDDLEAKALVVQAEDESPAPTAVPTAVRQRGTPLIELSPTLDGAAGSFEASPSEVHGRGHPGAPPLLEMRPAGGLSALLPPAVDVVQRAAALGHS